MHDRIPIYKVRLVRERWLVFPPFTADQPQVAALFFHRLIGNADREHSAVLFLDLHRRATGASIIGIGSLASTEAPAREVFKSALLANAHTIILAHNHPSRSREPSDQDVRLTRRLMEAGSIVGVRVHDHIIVTPIIGEFTSMREARLLPLEFVRFARHLTPISED
jgi:DNA repair protein RadC